MPIHNEEALLSYSLPSVYELEPDEVVLVFDRCTDKSRQIAKTITDHYKRKHASTAETVFVMANEPSDYEYRVAYLMRKGFAVAKNDSILVTAADIILDRQILGKTKQPTALVSFEYKDFPVSFRNVVKRLLECVLPLQWLSGIHLFSQRSWRETEDREKVKQISRAEDTFRADAIRTRYGTKLVLSNTVHLRERENREDHFQRGRAAYMVGRPFWLTILKAVVLLRLNEIKGYLHERNG